MEYAPRTEMTEAIREHLATVVTGQAALQRGYGGFQQAIVFLKAVGIPQAQLAFYLDVPASAISQYMAGRKVGKTILLRMYDIIENGLPDILAFQWLNSARPMILKAIENDILRS